MKHSVKTGTRDLKKKRTGGFSVGAAAAWCAIGLLAWADYNNVFTLLSRPEADIRPDEVVWYAFSMCLALEGFPTLLGLNLSKLTDKTSHKANDTVGAVIGSVVNLAGMLLVFAVFWIMKTAEIAQTGGKDTFIAGTNGAYITQLLLRVLPIITSLMALAISWSYFHAEAKKELEKQTQAAFDKYNRLHTAFRQTVSALELIRIRLWARVSGTDAMPKTLEDFRAQVCLRIRNMAVEKTVADLPLMLSRYDRQLENYLQSAICRMAEHSNIPLTVEQIDLQQALRTYDANQTCDGLVWAEEKAVKALGENLKYGIDNAVVVAQNQIFAR